MPNRIILRGDFVLEEIEASAAITPGHLVEVHSSSGTKVKKHATAKGFAEKMWAIEDPLSGATTTSVQSKTIDDAYASGDKVPCAIVQRGGLVFAYLKAGNNYLVGDKLVSAGDGTLQEATGSADAELEAVAYVVDALDLSASGASATRTAVRVA